MKQYLILQIILSVHLMMSDVKVVVGIIIFRLYEPVRGS